MKPVSFYLPLLCLLYLLGLLGLSAVVQGQAAPGDIQYPKPPVGKNYVLRSIQMSDAEKSDNITIVWIMDAWPFNGFKSLASARLRRWVGELPKGTVIVRDRSQAGPMTLEMLQEASSFGQFCESKGLIYRVVPH